MIKFFRILISSKTFLITTLLTFALIAVFGNPSFGSTDDYLLSGFVSGEYTGNKESRLVFIQYYPSVVFHLFSMIFPSYNGIYSLLLVVNVVLSLNLFFSIILKKKISGENNFVLLYIFYGLSIFIIGWISLNPTYTASSFLGGSIYGSIVLALLLQSNKKNYGLLVGATVLFMFSALIRPESLLAVIPFILIVILLNFNSFRLNVNELIFIGITIIIIYLINEGLYYLLDNSSWASYDAWNLMRHEIKNRQPEIYLANYLDQLNWTSVEYNLFKDVAFGERNVFTNSWLQKAHVATEKYRGIQGILNADFYLGLTKIEILISEWIEGLIAGLYVILIILRYTNRSNGIKIGYFLVISTLASSLILYASLNLFIPDRIFFPLLITMIFSFLNLYVIGSQKNFEKIKLGFISHILGIFAVIFFAFSPTGIIGQNQVNKERKIEYQGIVNKLKILDSNSIFYFPVNIDYYVIANPFKETFSSGTQKFLMLGNWDTFSPHWINRKKLIGLISDSTYSNLLEMKNVYWVGQNSPDTGFNVELLLKEMGKSAFTREGKIGLSGDLTVYSYYYVP